MTDRGHQTLLWNCYGYAGNSSSPTRNRTHLRNSRNRRGKGGYRKICKRSSSAFPRKSFYRVPRNWPESHRIPSFERSGSSVLTVGHRSLSVHVFVDSDVHRQKAVVPLPVHQAGHFEKLAELCTRGRQRVRRRRRPTCPRQTGRARQREPRGPRPGRGFPSGTVAQLPPRCDERRPLIPPPR